MSHKKITGHFSKQSSSDSLHGRAAKTLSVCKMGAQYSANSDALFLCNTVTMVTAEISIMDSHWWNTSDIIVCDFHHLVAYICI